MADTPDTPVAYGALLPFIRSLFRGGGCDDYTTETVSRALCEASLRGTDTHGIKLVHHYLRNMAAGGLNPAPVFKTTSPFPSVRVLDADNGPGIAAGCHAVDVGIGVAATSGVAAVLVHNSTHPGPLAAFGLRAARRGYVAICCTNTGPKMVSHNGVRPFFGTNPVCIAVPTDGGEPVVLDMATTAIPWNKVQQAKSRGGRMPPGVVVDAAGHPTTDPVAADALTPPGPAAAHKGYGLAAMVEVLSCALTGSAWGHHTIEMYRTEESLKQRRGLGQLYIVLRPDCAWVGSTRFQHDVAAMAAEVRAEPAQPGKTVMMPGDPEVATAERRRVAGVPVDSVTLTQLQSWAKQFGVPALDTSPPSAHSRL